MQIILFILLKEVRKLLGSYFSGPAKHLQRLIRPFGYKFRPLLVQTGSGAHPASYPMGTGGSFSGDKAAGA
jgi:hypothetical protein